MTVMVTDMADSKYNLNISHFNSIPIPLYIINTLLSYII